jgi:4-coumarate--CoA ligase
LIKVRGFQVAPAELEAVLMAHPSISAAAVIGIPAPDPVDGELPRTYVVRKAERGADRLSEDQVKQFAAERLAKYKHLNGGIVFMPDLPQTASGKYLKKHLRDLYKKTVTSSKTKV